MKFHAIRLSNLNSLKGQIAIELDQQPFVNVGLFAITGDTGAGKTTILDAITLALFAKTNREHEKEVMSNGTSECSAEVEFSNEKGRFLVRWQQKRSNRKADPLPITREMAAWDAPDSLWRVIAAGKTEVDGKGKETKGAVEHHLGLGFEQFKRTVLLAQGDFAAFLLSDERNRSAVLERLTDSEIYTQISKAAHDRAKETKQALDVLAVEKSARQLLSPDEIATYQQEQQTLVERSGQLQAQLAILRQQDAAIHQIIALERALADLEQEEQGLVQAIALRQPQAQRLQQHRNLLPYAALAAQWRDTISNQQQLTDDLANQAIALGALEGHLAQKTPVLAQLQTRAAAVADHLKSMEPVIRQVIQLDDQIQTQSDALRVSAQRLEDFREKSATLMSRQTAQTASLLQSRAQQETARQWMEEHPNTAQLDLHLPLIEQQLQPIRDAHKQCRQLATDIDQAKPQAAQLTERVTAAVSRFRAAESNNAATQQHWNDLCETLPVAWQKRGQTEETIALASGYLQSLEDFTRHFTDYREKLRHLAAVREQQENLSAAAENTLKLLFEAEDELDTARYQEELKRRRYEREQQVLNYERDRATLLTEGQPCPLCGSVHHPFLTEKSLLDFANDAQRDWNNARSALESVQNRYTRLNAELRDLGQSIRTLELDFGALLEHQADDLLYQPNEQEQRLALLHQQIATNEQNTVDLQETALTAQIASVKSTLAQLKAASSARQNAALALVECEKEKVVLEKEYEIHAQKIQYWEGELVQNKRSSEKLEADLDQLLAPYQIRFSPDAQFAAQLAELKAAQQAYQKQLEQKEKAVLAITSLEAELTEIARSLTERQQEWQQTQAEYDRIHLDLQQKQDQRKVLFGDRNPLTAQAEWEEDIAQIRANMTDLTFEMQQITNDITIAQTRKLTLSEQIVDTDRRKAETEATLAKHFPDSNYTKDLVAYISDAILPEEQVQALEREQEQMAQRSVALHTRRQSYQNDLQAAKALPGATDDIKVVAEALEQAESERARTEQRLGAIATELSNNEQRSREASTLLAQMTTLELDWDRQEQLKKLIGSADGLAFRRYAQSLTLDQLVHYANGHLSRLQGGRYRLQKRPDTDLELEISDTFQANFVRSVNTLSGGETFLVSLALALGLADMTNRKTRIQSLFIDEGFGALDETALEMAIQTLESLQSQGVTIGVITHIREMINRITTQIRVMKRSDGFSVVEIGY